MKLFRETKCSSLHHFSYNFCTCMLHLYRRWSQVLGSLAATCSQPQRADTFCRLHSENRCAELSRNCRVVAVLKSAGFHKEFIFSFSIRGELRGANTQKHENGTQVPSYFPVLSTKLPDAPCVLADAPWASITNTSIPFTLTSTQCNQWHSKQTSSILLYWQQIEDK